MAWGDALRAAAWLALGLTLAAVAWLRQRNHARAVELASGAGRTTAPLRVLLLGDSFAPKIDGVATRTTKGACLPQPPRAPLRVSPPAVARARSLAPFRAAAARQRHCS